MPSRAEVEDHAAVQAAIIAMAWKQFQDQWPELGIDPRNVLTDAAVQSVTDLLLDLVEVWGDAAATTAADFYDEMRARAGVGGSFTAILAGHPPRAQVEASVRWALDPTPQTVGGKLPAALDVDLMRGKIEGPLQRLIRQTGRRTVDDAVARDPARPRVARVPMGDETCGFCLVLASRGPVYRSLEAAGHDSRFHNFDDCEQVVVWSPDEPLPEGYNPGDLYAKYETARVAAGSGDLRAILRELRVQEGVR